MFILFFQSKKIKFLKTLIDCCHLPAINSWQAKKVEFLKTLIACCLLPKIFNF